jgi:hypothetical protein
MSIVDDCNKKIKSTLKRKKDDIYQNFLLTINTGAINITFLICIGWVQNGSRLFLYELNIILGGDSNALYNH